MTTVPEIRRKIIAVAADLARGKDGRNDNDRISPAFSNWLADIALRLRDIADEMGEWK